MSDIPEGVLLLYTMNRKPYKQQSYSTTARVFVPDPLLHPKAKFIREAPLLDSRFQVDKPLE